MRKQLFLLSLAALMVACGGQRRPLMAELQQKIDSIQTQEAVKELERQGVTFKEQNPLEMFYDSLGLQVLPVRYSDDYVKYLPNFSAVPLSIKTFLNLEGRETPKAIALTETLGAKLIILAADVADNEYELWLYSLDSECYPVDKLQLYEPSKFSPEQLKMNSQENFFSITSDYEISVMEYADENDKVGQLSTYVVDESRQFVEKQALLH